jgi:hypothetical protein
VRNETKTKRNETEPIETKWNRLKRNETNRNETEPIETKRNHAETKRNQSKRNETNQNETKQIKMALDKTNSGECANIAAENK